MKDLAPPGVLAYADRVDAAPDGCSSLHRRGRAGRGRSVRRVGHKPHHEVLRKFWPVSFTDRSHHREIGATILEEVWSDVETAGKAQCRFLRRHLIHTDPCLLASLLEGPVK